MLSLHVKLVTAVSTASNSVDIYNIQLSLVTITATKTIHTQVKGRNTTVDVGNGDRMLISVIISLSVTGA